MKKSGTSWTLGGAIIAAIAASLCCVGPLLALGLGLGSFAASAFFAQWRPVLLGVTFALLGIAWYLAYRPPKAACDDSSCAHQPSKATRFALWFGTIVAVVSSVNPWITGMAIGGSNTAAIAASANAETFSVSIPTMDCAACAKGIEATLRRTPGVLRADVSYDTKRAEIAFDPTITKREKLLTQIDDTGFSAERASLK